MAPCSALYLRVENIFKKTFSLEDIFKAAFSFMSPLHPTGTLMGSIPTEHLPRRSATGSNTTFASAAGPSIRGSKKWYD